MTVKKEQVDASQTAKDLFAGAAGGVAQVLIGQPFDIVKVRLQTAAARSSALATATQIYHREGPLAFYKGTLTPLVGIGACVSIQFAAFHQARRWFEARQQPSSTAFPTSSDSAAAAAAAATAAAPSLSPAQSFLAGVFAGVANSVLSTPIEHVRIRLQTQPHGPARLYSGPLACAATLGPAGLYRGLSVTVLREAVAYGAWFLTFESLMARAGDRAAVPTWKIALYGGLAGEALWLASYPLDVVKSRMQTDGFGPARRYSTWINCARSTWAAEGLAGFWRGIGPTLLRAMPVSAGTFAVVEMTMRAINK